MKKGNSAEDMDATKRIQNKTLSMLISLSAILRKNDIPFFLAYGTALGCARHQGFIPWDDDMDVYIMGTDYPKLQKIFAAQDTGNLVLHDFSTVRDYPYCFPKIVAGDTVLVENTFRHLDYRCGIYIDVFPLAAAPDRLLARTAMQWKRYFYYGLLHAFYVDFQHGYKGILHRLVRRIISPQSVQKALYRQYIRSEERSIYLADTGAFGKQALLKRKWFEEQIYLPFESCRFPMTAEYDAYLTHYYGDYHTLPPEHQRVPSHHFAVLSAEQKEEE